MAWRIWTSVADAKRAFLLDCERDPESFALLCEHYRIGRSAAYDLLRRARSEGIDAAIVARSRAPRHVHNRLSEDVVHRILSLRVQLGYGPKKLHRLYKQCFDEKAPSRASMANVLHRYGLSRDYCHRRRGTTTKTLTQATAPNDVWSADFKGRMKQLNVEPLNIIDLHSRFWLLCDPFARHTYQDTRAAFERSFADYGVPRVLRVDRGVPWAAVSPSGLTDFSAWLVRLGVVVEFVPRCQDNGCVERLHGTMERTMDRTGVGDLRVFFEKERAAYNDLRPHEALNQEVPASIYVKSRRRQVERKPDYANCDVVRRLDRRGYINWCGARIYVCETLSRQDVGMRQLDSERYHLRYHHHTVGILDLHAQKLTHA